MRDTLPKTGPWVNESGIVNLDSSKGSGSHWVAYMKRVSIVEYYDSFAVSLCSEIQKYFINRQIIFNYEQDQQIDQVICGHSCLKFLSNYVN